MAAQIAVRDHADQSAVRPGHTDASEPFRRQSDQGLTHGRVEADQGHLRARVHDIPDPQQLSTKLSAWVKHAEIIRGEASSFEQGDRERIAQRQHHRGRCGRRQRQNAGFVRSRRISLISASRARLLVDTPVIASSGMANRREKAMTSFNSGVSPELDSARTVSSTPTMPRSPWLASPGCKNRDGVPVEASVAAILRAICPDFPIPVTTTRPSLSWMRSTASEKLSPAIQIVIGVPLLPWSAHHGQPRRHQTGISIGWTLDLSWQTVMDPGIRAIK